MKRARTVLVAVHDVFLDAVARWVADDARIEVVGRARSGAQALECVESLRAELVLLDVSLPDMSGFEVARRIKAGAQAPLVVMLSFHDSHAARGEAWAAGADGFVAKGQTANRLIPLVGDLLRQRSSGAAKGSVIPALRVAPTDRSE